MNKARARRKENSIWGTNWHCAENFKRCLVLVVGVIFQPWHCNSNGYRFACFFLPESVNSDLLGNFTTTLLKKTNIRVSKLNTRVLDKNCLYPVVFIFWVFVWARMQQHSHNYIIFQVACDEKLLSIIKVILVEFVFWAALGMARKLLLLLEYWKV